MEVKIIIDGKKIKTKEALHAFFKKELNSQITIRKV